MATIHKGKMTVMVWVIMGILLIVYPCTSRAELFVELYFGGAFAQDEDIDVTISAGGVTADATAKDVDFDSSYTLGGRVGYWFPEVGADPNWLAIALDISYFQPNAEDTDITVVSFSPLIVLRYPGERFQPYFAIGPSIFRTDIETKFGAFGLPDFNDYTLDLGLDTRAGLAFKFHDNWAVFGEYRFSYYKAELSDTIIGVKVNVEYDSLVHYALFGISYRF